MRSYLRVGVVAGFGVGLLFALYTSAVFSPIMERAEAFEPHGADGSASHAGPHAVQAAGSIAGIDVVTVAGNLAWVIALGVLAAIGYYFAEPALASLDRRVRGLLVGLSGFVALRVAPWPVYPPVSPAAELSLPPAVYVPWYWAIVAVTVLAFLSLPFVHRFLRDRYGTRTVALGLLTVLLIPVVVVVVAPRNQVEAIGAPTALHYRYMAAVVGGQLAVWTALGLAIGHFAGIERPTGRPVEPVRRAG